MGGLAGLSKLGHVTENGNAFSPSRKRLHRLQSRQKGVRIGVVGVVDDADTAECLHLHSHRRRTATLQALVQFLPAQAQLRRKRHCERGVPGVLMAQQVDAVGSAPISLRRNQFESCPLIVQRNAGKPPVAALPLPDRDNCCAAADADGLQPLDVSIDKQAALRRQHLCQLSLLLDHPFEVPEKLQMLAPDARQHAVPWPDELQQRLQFAGMIRADLEHRRLVGPAQPQQCERHPDIVVETGLARERLEPLPQHCRQDVLGAGFAVGAAHRNNRQLKIPPVPGRQSAKRIPRLLHLDPRPGDLRLAKPGSADHSRLRPLAKRVVEVVMPVKLVTANRHEQVARLGQARVGADAAHTRRAFARDELPVTALLHKT